MDRAERPGGALHRAVDASALPDVARLDVSRPVDRRGRLLESRLPAREERDRRAVAREPQRDRAPDSRAGTRHDDVLPGHPRSGRSQFAAFPSTDPLAGGGTTVVDCRCAEHGTRVGRSPPGRPYAEAEGQPGRWTKAHPARRILGPVSYVEHTRALRKCVRIVKKNTQRAAIAFCARLTTPPRGPSVPGAPRKERPRLMALRQAVASADGRSVGRTREHRPRCIFAWNSRSVSLSSRISPRKWKMSQFAT